MRTIWLRATLGSIQSGYKVYGLKGIGKFRRTVRLRVFGNAMVDSAGQYYVLFQ